MGTTTVPLKRRGTPTLFDDEADAAKGSKGADVDLDEDLGVDLDNDDWILDDLGGGMNDDDGEKRWAAKEGVREMGNPDFVEFLGTGSLAVVSSQCHKSSASFPTRFDTNG